MKIPLKEILLYTILSFVVNYYFYYHVYKEAPVPCPVCPITFCPQRAYEPDPDGYMPWVQGIPLVGDLATDGPFWTGLCQRQGYRIGIVDIANPDGSGIIVFYVKEQLTEDEKREQIKLCRFGDGIDDSNLISEEGVAGMIEL